MLKARRPLAAALVVGAGALALTGCIPLPPALPQAPVQPTQQPVDPAMPPATEAPSAPASQEPTAPEAGEYPYTVDDGLGDTWSFDVTGVVADPPMETGEPASGTYFVGVVIDAQHVEGDVGFRTCFDIFVLGSDGELYDWRDTISVTAENDVFFADDMAFTDAVAAVQLPEGVDPAQIIIRSTYGYPDVPDTVIEVR